MCYDIETIIIGTYFIERNVMGKNGLKSKMEEIFLLCKELEERDINTHWFGEPADENEITAWEKLHGIQIPETYKEWLRFANGANICSPVALLFPLKNLSVEEKFLPMDLVWIGEVFGDGELICFSKRNGKFIRYFEGARKEVEDFSEILQVIIHLLKDDLDIPDMSDIHEQNELLQRAMSNQDATTQPLVKNIIQMPSRKKSMLFNLLEPKYRHIFLMMITPQEQKSFIEDIRHQGVVDFWNRERGLLREGKATRDWESEEMEEIYNIGESGYEQLNAKPPLNRDLRRNIIFGSETCYARRMIDINFQP